MTGNRPFNDFWNQALAVRLMAREVGDQGRFFLISAFYFGLIHQRAYLVPCLPNQVKAPSAQSRIHGAQSVAG